MLNIIANAEYRHGAENSTPKSYQKKAQKLFAELGENVEIVKIQCNYSSSKYHLFAFGEDVSKPLYRQQGRIEISEKQRALHGPDYRDGADHFYAVWSDWQDGTGYTEYQAQAKAAIEKYRKTQEVKAAKAEPVEQVQFWANQAWRDGIVLATIEDRALIAYRMPAGAVYMVIVAHDPNTGAAKRQWECGSSYVKGYRYGSYKSISANALKKNAKWLAEVVKVEGFEEGNVDQGLEYLAEDLE
jgi:hypothetical protein